jgi:GT2 family glycosyltransferase
MRIAVLMTCHNRKSKTLESLAALQQQGGIAWPLDIYLVDDGSLDGTTAAVQQQYPQMIILQGTGKLFWNGGMRLAFEQAMKQDYDFYLWLNDDTTLYPDALARLFSTFNHLIEIGEVEGIISGSTQDAQVQNLVSGGFRWVWPKFLMRFELMEPQEQALPCDTISGNCVLVPRSIVQTIGNLNPYFSHFLGDLDYGLKAKRLGYPIWIAPGYVGTSPQHHNRGNELEQMNGLQQVYQKLYHPKGLSVGNDLQQRFLPIHEWTLFLKEYSGLLWVIPWILTYSKLVGLILGRWPWRLGKRRTCATSSRS